MTLVARLTRVTWAIRVTRVSIVTSVTKGN